MVSRTVVSEYSPDAGPNDGERQISGGPFYDLQRVVEIARSDGGLVLWTRTCIANVAALSLDAAGVAQMLEQLSALGRYCGSEWCQNGREAWAACDAYQLRRPEWIEAAQKEMTVEYYLKFAIGQSGRVVLIASCHV
jgi:hypothetical protein